MVSLWLELVDENLQNVPIDRHNTHIQKLAEWIAGLNNNGEKAQLNFICTHNSRRSQFAQTWSDVIQKWLKVDFIDSFSGGTEVTACNERTIAALSRTGLNVEIDSNKDSHPVYLISDDQLDLNVKLWSKVYDDKTNPDSNFAAIMTCDHADQNCPFIPGAELRIPLTYTDPKYADDTDEEQEAYDHTCRIIATDMLRLFKQVELLTS